MFELFSPLYLLRVHSYETPQMGIYTQYAVWFVALATVIEALVQSSESFFARHTGRSLLWIQCKTIARLGVSYLLCTLVVLGVMTYLFQVETNLGELFTMLGLAILPRVYAVYGLIPYIGKTLRRFLNVWTLVLLFLVLQRSMGLDTGPVLVCLSLSLLAYGAIAMAFARLPQRPSVSVETTEI